MQGYVANIEQVSVDNGDFRRVLYTAKHCQLVVMSLLPGEEIGEEVHDVDQFLRVDAGQGRVVLNGANQNITDGSAIVVPAGTKHNIINMGTEPLKLYTLYAPPHHKDGTVHHTKADALANDEEFDGKTTE